MKNLLKIKMVLLALVSGLIVSCGSARTGSANDTTGTNGATNGTGKVPKSSGVHNYRN